MNFRLNKVTRIMNWLGFKKLYSLILKDNTLYIIRTGNVGAIANYKAKGLMGEAIVSGITKKFVEELEAGEKRLNTESLDQLSQENGSSRVSLSEINKVEVKYGHSPEMKLQTNKGDFKFVFTLASEDEVKKLAETLKS